MQIPFIVNPMLFMTGLIAFVSENVLMLMIVGFILLIGASILLRFMRKKKKKKSLLKFLIQIG